MTKNDYLFEQIANLAVEIKESFREQGIVLPSVTKEGNVKIGNYFISKTILGFYSIKNRYKEVFYDNINLPHTALLIANSLASGIPVDKKIINLDRDYGYSSFEDRNFARLLEHYELKKDWARYDATIVKQEIAQNKSNYSKNELLRYFEKFRRLR
jgi:hypothetical protein